MHDRLRSLARFINANLSSGKFYSASFSLFIRMKVKARALQLKPKRAKNPSYLGHARIQYGLWTVSGQWTDTDFH